MTNFELLKEFIFRMSISLSPDEKVESIDSFTTALAMPQLDLEAISNIVHPVNTKLTKAYITSTLKNYEKLQRN